MPKIIATQTFFVRSKRRMIQDDDAPAEKQEMTYFSGHFSVLNTDVHSNIISYLPAFHAVIRYAHLTQKTRFAATQWIHACCPQIALEFTHSFLTQSVKPNLCHLFLNEKNALAFFHQPEKILSLFHLRHLISNQIPIYSHFENWMTIADHFCAFVNESEQNQEIAFQYIRKQTNYCSEKESTEKRAFEVLIAILMQTSKSAWRLHRKAQYVFSVKSFHRELAEVCRQTDKFFDQHITPMIRG